LNWSDAGGLYKRELEAEGSLEVGVFVTPYTLLIMYQIFLFLLITAVKVDFIDNVIL